MDLDELQRHWTQLGKDDPLWAVLTDPSKKGGRWEPAEFFETGRTEIEHVAGVLGTRGVEMRGQKAMDFGCGVGRLTQALARRFGEVHGIDISPSMLEQARRFAPASSGCQFHLNEAPHLRLFPDANFDFVYSNIALMHMDPKFATGYIREFIRLLKPGGTAVFQHLTPKGWRRFIPQSLAESYRKWKHRNEAYISMFGISERAVRDLVAEEGGKILHLETEPHGSRWTSLRFYVQK